MNRSKGKFVQFHTLQSLWSQIPVTLLNSGLVAWTIVNLVRDLSFTSYYWSCRIMAGLANGVYFIFSIIGAVKARKGVFYCFLFFGKISYHQVYRIRPERFDSAPVNRPPGQ